MERKGFAAASPRRRRQTWAGEDGLQKSVIEFCQVAIKRPDRFWWVPQGNNLSKAQAGKSKAMGLTAGVSDLHFAWAIGAVRQFPCFGTIELKWGKNTETAEQAAFGGDLVKLGHSYRACWTIDEVVATLTEWGVPLHARLGPQGIVLSGPAAGIKRA